MRVARRICEARDDVIFVVVGADRMYYGQQQPRLGTASFREHVMAREDYDLGRFLFTGQILEDDLARILSRSDLHIYLTVPFVLSWSLMDALACGCTVLASDTAPVREMICHEGSGLLAGFGDVDVLTEQALRVLDDTEAFRPLSETGTRMIHEQYSVEAILPRIRAFYEEVASRPS
jgi:glycosyltransferase involved in cell wall biosynthesis